MTYGWWLIEKMSLTRERCSTVQQRVIAVCNNKNQNQFNQKLFIKFETAVSTIPKNRKINSTSVLYTVLVYKFLLFLIPILRLDG